MAQPGLIALFGSGETSTQGRKIHDYLLARLAVPVPVAMLELLGPLRLTVKVSLASNSVSPDTATVMVPVVEPAVMVNVPAVETRKTHGRGSGHLSPASSADGAAADDPSRTA